jgi:hypothetical protein
MSVNAHAIKEIIYDKSIEGFNMSGLFASSISTENDTLFCLTPDNLEIAEVYLNSDDEMEELVANGTYTAEDVKQAREECEYYKKILKEKKLEFIEFECY